ncbi:MAG: DUF2783 domain-containing protein [Acetobacteraceae bacterium]|nr:DUF2783 domain-containing protein [Acetobacteraceae bacterium]
MRLDPNIPDPDAFYAAVIEANEGRSLEDSLRFALRLCLLLANQIDDQQVLMDAIAAARSAALNPETAS